MDDFTAMEKKGKANNIGIVFDFVVNHTSDKHKWFIESASSKTNPYHDWYIWKDPKGTNQPPNNWTSTFGGSAWQWNPKPNQFYYHYFYPQQPDLNWRNPKVEGRHVRCHALLVQARRGGLPPRCCGYAVRRPEPDRQPDAARQERVRRSEPGAQIQRQASRSACRRWRVCARWRTSTTRC